MVEFQRCQTPQSPLGLARSSSASPSRKSQIGPATFSSLTAAPRRAHRPRRSANDCASASTPAAADQRACRGSACRPDRGVSCPSAAAAAAAILRLRLRALLGDLCPSWFSLCRLVRLSCTCPTKLDTPRARKLLGGQNKRGSQRNSAVDSSWSPPARSRSEHERNRATSLRSPSERAISSPSGPPSRSQSSPADGSAPTSKCASGSSRRPSRSTGKPC